MSQLLLQGDSLFLLNTIERHSVDVIVTDPPYNLAGYSTGNIDMSWRKSFNNNIDTWDTLPFYPQAWKQDFLDILKPTGTIFAFTSYNLLGEWHKTFDPVFDTFQFMVWKKTNPPPKLRRAGFLNACELIVCMWNKGHTWNFSKQAEMHNFIEGPICMGKERVKIPERESGNHPTQKPLYVLKRLIELSSHKGDMILDPFMGVGSTGVAAAELERNFIGIELDPVYFTYAQKRLQQYDNITDSNLATSA